VLCKLAGIVVHLRPTWLEWNEAEFAMQKMWSIKDEEQIKQAVAVRLTPTLRKRARQAIKEIEQGKTVQFTY
jgi:hypothetical protein